MNQTAEGLASVAPILQLAEARGVEMPIVRAGQAMVLAGTLEPARHRARTCTTDSDEPQGRKDSG